MTTKDEVLAAVDALKAMIVSAWPVAVTPTPTPAPVPTTTSEISFASPAVGVTLSGSVNQCVLNTTSEIAYVRFYIDDDWIRTAKETPFACNVDTIKLKTGPHTLRADAFTEGGKKTTVNLQINVRNGDTVAINLGAISAADIKCFASANVPFVDQQPPQYPLWWANANGQGVRSSDLPEEGIKGSMLPNGETVRLGKVADPTNPARKALAFQLAPDDAITNGSHRCELEFDAKNLEYDKVYWVAFRAYVYDWGTLPTDSEALFGLQFHSGDTEKGFSPSLALVTYGRQGGGRTFQVWGTYSTSKTPTADNAKKFNSNEIPIPFGRWVDFVFKVKENVNGGLAQAWMDDAQILNYTGPVGYLTPGINSYSKHGFYNWSGTDRVKKVLLQSPVTVYDPTGSKYKPEDLRAFVNQ